LSGDGKLLGTASRDSTVRFWDAMTGEPEGSPIVLPAFVQMLRFRPDIKYLATASVDGSVRLYDVATRSLCAIPIQHEMMAMSVSFSPDGKWLASGSFDKKVKVWPMPDIIKDLEEMELRTWAAL